MNAAPARSLFAVLPTAIVAVLPKCPLCVLSIAATLGIELPISQQWLLPVTLALLALSVTLIAKMAHPHIRRSTFAIALLGASSIAIGRLGGGPATPLLHLGVAVIILASLRATRSASCLLRQPSS